MHTDTGLSNPLFEIARMRAHGLNPYLRLAVNSVIARNSESRMVRFTAI